MQMSESNGQHVPDVFDEFLPPQELRIKGRDGQVRVYLVNESNGGEDFWSWLAKSDAVINSQEVDASKARELPDMQATLICQCVTLDGKPVSRDTVLGWGMSLRNKAFAMCMEQNKLTKAGVDAEGKG